MGAIIGLLNLGIGFWFYSATLRAGKQPPALWGILGVAVFLGLVITGFFLSYYLAGLIYSDIDRDSPLAVGILVQFSPIILGLVGCFIVRRKYILPK